MEDYVEVFKALIEQEIKKLTDVGFTRQQAEVLLELIRSKRFTGLI